MIDISSSENIVPNMNPKVLPTTPWIVSTSIQSKKLPKLLSLKSTNIKLRVAYIKG